MMLTIRVTPFVNIMISTVYKQVATVKIIATALEKFYFQMHQILASKSHS